jgi:hypothetical protein
MSLEKVVGSERILIINGLLIFSGEKRMGALWVVNFCHLWHLALQRHPHSVRYTGRLSETTRIVTARQDQLTAISCF